LEKKKHEKIIKTTGFFAREFNLWEIDALE
jgi:hypothetical protein